MAGAVGWGICSVATSLLGQILRVAGREQVVRERVQGMPIRSNSRSLYGSGQEPVASEGMRRKKEAVVHFK
jgi:hypothetical protein